MTDRPDDADDLPTSTVSECFPPEPASAQRARALVRAALERASHVADVELATLLTSELATNAVRHARSAFLVRATTVGPRLRVEVSDRHPARPEPRQPAAADTSGRGMMLVDILADDWGVADRHGGGKVVWFELGVPSARATGG